MSSLIGSGPTGRASGLKGTGYNQVSLPTISPDQQELYSLLRKGSQGGVGAGLSHLSKLASGDQSGFDQMEKPALRQFSKLQGNIGSAFSGMGTGARNSSAFQNASSEAGVDFAERLAGNRMNFQRDAIQQLLGLSRDLLGTQTQQNFLTPEKIPFWKQLLSMFGGGAGQIGGLVGGMGALKGLGLG